MRKNRPQRTATKYSVVSLSDAVHALSQRKQQVDPSNPK